MGQAGAGPAARPVAGAPDPGHRDPRNPASIPAEPPRRASREAAPRSREIRLPISAALRRTAPAPPLPGALISPEVPTRRDGSVSIQAEGGSPHATETPAHPSGG